LNQNDIEAAVQSQAVSSGSKLTPQGDEAMSAFAKNGHVDVGCVIA
jgi:hypothetical protein